MDGYYIIHYHVNVNWTDFGDHRYKKISDWETHQHILSLKERGTENIWKLYYYGLQIDFYRTLYIIFKIYQTALKGLKICFIVYNIFILVFSFFVKGYNCN